MKRLTFGFVSKEGPVVGGYERGIRDGIQAGHGTCYCLMERCFCEKEDDEGQYQTENLQSAFPSALCWLISVEWI